ncbi:MAG: HesA/MoeB/ThiF family protein [Oscillospiraceae bacterium]|jgi:molybdopterin/thiamine biosynthesis adenylyltransferase|nr:HesA/MoeB/ThiF family protein [Oscillospiraceae bacterium]
MEERYIRNIPAVSPAEQEALSAAKVVVVGCGGLGGYLIEYLGRMGVGTITAVDGDVFEPSNLNRQILSEPALLGRSKAAAAKERLARINPFVTVHEVEAFLDGDNAAGLVAEQDLALDALDSVPARLLLADACAEAGVPLVHGAIRGWWVQAAVVPPGSGLLHRLYASKDAAGTVEDAPEDKASLPFTPAFCAAIQAAEAVKLLTGQPSSLEGRLLLSDLRRMDWDVLPL